MNSVKHHVTSKEVGEGMLVPEIDETLYFVEKTRILRNKF